MGEECFEEYYSGAFMNWKVGDKFIISGVDSELFAHSLLDFKGSVRIIKKINPSNISYLWFENPKDPDNSPWYCPIDCAVPYTKLHKALS